MKGALKVEDKFRTKKDCMRAIKKFHMENSVDYTIDRTDVRWYVILQIHVASQPNLCLISDRHASIESAYNNLDNGWKDSPSTHVYYIRHIS